MLDFYGYGVVKMITKLEITLPDNFYECLIALKNDTQIFGKELGLKIEIKQENEFNRLYFFDNFMCGLKDEELRSEILGLQNYIIENLEIGPLELMEKYMLKLKSLELIQMDRQQQNRVPKIEISFFDDPFQPVANMFRNNPMLNYIYSMGGL